MRSTAAHCFRRFLLVLAALAAGNGPVVAGTVVATNFALGAANAGTSHPVAFGYAEGLFPNGQGIIAIGTFTGVTDAQIAAATSFSDLPAILAAFSQFGSSGPVGGPSTLNMAGMFKLTASQSIPADSPFLGRPIYLVMGNGATVAGSTRVFVFKSTQTFPVDGSGLTPVVSVTGTPDGSILRGKLRRGAEIYYAAGPFAGQPLQPITIDREDEPDPYDTWISQFFPLSDPRGDPMADPDEDGLVNGRERGAGTLPNDFASAPRILSVGLLPQNVTVVTWSSAAGVHYHLRASEDGVTFSKVGSATATGPFQSLALNTPRPKVWLFKVDVFAP
jgi:hypothetical protein